VLEDRVTRTVPSDASDNALREIVVEWSELLAQERYAEALDLCPPSDKYLPWDADLLQKAVRGYGIPDSDPEVVEMMLEDWGVDSFVVSSLAERLDRDEIVRDGIRIDREHHFGLDPAHYAGMVHYHDVPVSGYRSDLTAQFHIKRVGPDRLMLEFLAMHVM
jgi:hypothetical protein